MTDTITQDWTPCMKLPVVVHVRKQRPGETHVSTREGITPVKPDDLIMRGVSGEEYPIGKEIFEKTYTLDVDAPAAQPAQEPEAFDSIEEMAATRYKVVPSDSSMFYCFAVVAGDGKQQLYLGREAECRNMAAKFTGAFLDGAFVQQQMRDTAPVAQPAQEPHQWVGLTDEELLDIYKQHSWADWDYEAKQTQATRLLELL